MSSSERQRLGRTVSSDEINLNAERLQECLYFSVEDDYIVIECNQCSVDDYVFSKTFAGTSGERDWIIRAAEHMKKYHLRVLR